MKFTVHAIALLSVLGMWSAANGQDGYHFHTVRLAERAVFNNDGDILYKIYLDPIYAMSLEDEAARNGFVQPQLDASSFRVGNEEIEQPAVRYLAHSIAGIIGKQPKKIISWVGTQFEIEAKPFEIQRLIGQRGIVDIAEMEGAERVPLTYSQTSAPGDVYASGEIIPWWKIYTNTNDALTSSNRIYVIDGPNVSPLVVDLAAVSTTNSWDLGEWVGKPAYWGFWHSKHVLGVIGAAQNGYQIRGINPGQQVVLYGGDSKKWPSIFDRLNVIASNSHIYNLWGVVNLSINVEYHVPWSFNPFEIGSSDDVGRAMAIVSNTNLIMQSAGNNNSSDCGVGYNIQGNTLPWDGIMLIGGHDINGQRSAGIHHSFHNDGHEEFIGDSDYGPCVELWAPSKNITSIRHNTLTTQVLSGTSFAAPIAAAIASRYGNDKTRPIERESFLRTFAQNTGHFAGSAPIKSVKWNSSTANVLKRHTISSFWSPQGASGINVLKDGSYEGIWNSGGNIGAIVIDLGATKNVKMIRLTPRSSVSPYDTQPIHFSVAPTNSIINTAGTGPFQNDQAVKHYDRTPHTINLANPLTTRYLVVNGHNYGSWLAYSEVEVYGN